MQGTQDSDANLKNPSPSQCVFSERIRPDLKTKNHLRRLQNENKLAAHWIMRSLRRLIEKTLFPTWTRGQRRRHMRFLMLGILLGMFIAVAFGAMLYLVNGQHRM